MKARSIFIGFDPREAAALAVCRYSLNRHLTQQIPVRGVVLNTLIAKGLYTRPLEWRTSAADKPVMWDTISNAPMSTQHAVARFLVPFLAKRGWALFCDGDFMFRSNVARLFDSLDENYALYCVKHKYEPKDTAKMDGQIQTTYARKNWSSFVIWNCDHPANKALTIEMVNTLPGRDLHRFCWLSDELIGEISQEWNFIVGHSNSGMEPKAVHFSEGLPDMAGYENVPWSNEWRLMLEQWGG